MPYIKPDQRHLIYDGEERIIKLDGIHCAGDFNYAVTIIMKHYIETFGENYQHYNDLIGALEGAKLELYRRHISIMEDKKIKENGDV